MSLPTNFLQVGSASSGHSVRDAIASYRRAQYLVVGSTVAESLSDNSDPFFDEEAGIGFHTQPADPSSDSDGFIGQFDWDDAPDDTSEPTTPRATLPFSRKVAKSPSRAPQPVSTERTPLLRKSISFTESPHPRRTSAAANERPSEDLLTVPHVGVRRRSSAASARSMKYHYSGQSTFGQTGIGMLSEPLAFAYAGWGMGLVLIIFYGFISCYTAKILAGIILSDPRLRSYADIGRKAFGPRSTVIISILFCLELFAVSVILVTLYADSLHSLIPRYSSDTYKLWGILILIPTVFLPLSLLSYTSILGIVSTIFVVIVILVDGVSKTDAPGSIWSPAETFSGHAVIPSLARDMIDPSEFGKMINWAFIVATFIYTLIACAGYLMFGNSVSAEISIDLLNTPGYNAALNQAALWMLVISPLSKFALTTQPLNTAIQILLGIDRPLSAPEDLAAKLAEPRRISIKSALGVIQRIIVTLLSFSAAMAFLGSFSAFVLCVIGPICAKIALEGRCGVFDGAIVALAVVMAVWGTGAAFMDAT
ncbi:transmembrane amino acid transporter protein-domain-containing protein [Mycena rebaudengoi]|nr:transmembrane amino acid transporter protein-domain-containing protein [Mycena rebaudengoi]